MSLIKKLKQKRARRALRVRGNLDSNALARVSVFRSSKHIYAQVIDDALHKTVASFSSMQLKDAQGDKSSIAHQVGLELGKLISSAGIQKVCFDRGRFLYHGRVKALAEGLRESGVTV